MLTCDKCARIASFRADLNENPHRSISEAYFRWKIDQNPFGAGHVALERRGNIDVGSATLTPKRIYALGGVVFGAEIGDTFTLKDYQRQGIFSRCVTECREYAVRNGIDIIYPLFRKGFDKTSIFRRFVDTCSKV